MMRGPAILVRTLDRWVVFALLLMLASGCAMSRRGASPLDWPSQWGDRSLFTTPAGHFYARTPQIADELDRVVAKAARAYRRDAGVEPPTVTVIVVDVEDPPWPCEPAELLRAAAACEATVKEPAAERKPGDAERNVDQAARQAEEAGISLDVLVAMTPLLCDSAMLQDMLGAPTELVTRVQTVLILPTDGLIHRNTKQMLRSTLERQGVGPVAQLMLAPILTLVELKTAELMSAAREVAVYEFWAFTNPAWSADEKQRHVAAYRQARLGAVAETPAAHSDAGTGPADSQPAAEATGHGSGGR